MSEVSNDLEIAAYLNCGKCLEERPSGIAAVDWASLSIGWTPLGIQVWCNRHECNVLHVDFEGQRHPADTTRIVE